MGISQAYNSLRSALAREVRKARLDGKTSFGSPSDRDYWVADAQIDAMSNTSLLIALEAHEDLGNLPENK